jgi:hypothetical protein
MNEEERRRLTVELADERACLWVYENIIGGAPPRALRAATRIREIEKLLATKGQQECMEYPCTRHGVCHCSCNCGDETGEDCPDCTDTPPSPTYKWWLEA